MLPQIQLFAEELYTVIGELEIVRRKLTMQLQGLLVQVDEMSQEIAKLNEKLVNSGEANNLLMEELKKTELKEDANV